MSVEASRVVEALPDMVWTALADGSIDFVNQRWCEFTNLGVAESYGAGVAGGDSSGRSARIARTLAIDRGFR